MIPVKSYNIAIAGYGAFGRFLKRAWERLPNVRVIAITRSTLERARESAEADGIPRYSSRYDDLLTDPDVDIVVVATPPYLHSKQAVAALQAGKHVLIEKPPATNVPDAERILETALSVGRRATVNLIMRYNPIAERVKQVVDGRLLGSLYRVIQENYASSQGLGSDHWFWDISKSGGILVEHGVHFFDLANWMIGTGPSQVHGFFTSRAAGLEDKVLANVQYSDGTLATFYNSFSRPAAVEKTWGVYVFDRGEIVTEGWVPLKLKLRGFVSEAELSQLRSIFDGAELAVEPVEVRRMESGGRVYEVAHAVDLKFRLGNDKEKVYAQSAADLLSDFIQSIEEPSHETRVTLEDAIASLRIACAASAYRKQESVYQPLP